MLCRSRRSFTDHRRELGYAGVDEEEAAEDNEEAPEQASRTAVGDDRKAVCQEGLPRYSGRIRSVLVADNCGYSDKVGRFVCDCSDDGQLT